MGFWNGFPFTNFHELNLDWIIEKVKNLEVSFTELKENVNVKLETGLEAIDTAISAIPLQVKQVIQKMVDSGQISSIIDTYYGGFSYMDSLHDKQITILGDSLSDESADRCWVKSFKKITEGKKLTIKNYSHSGDTVAEQWALFKNATVKPDILIIWCGVNDVKKQTAIGSLSNTFDEIRDKVQSLNPKCQVYLFSTYKNYRVLPSSWIIPQTAYWRFYSQYAQQNGWTFVDMFAYAPVISPETATMRNYFYEETESGFLHYDTNYTDILARFIVNILVNQMPIALGDYWERINGKMMIDQNMFKDITEFTPNENGSHIRFGTRFVKIRFAGAFKPSNPSSLQYVKIATLPDYLFPASSIYTLAFRGGGWTDSGANATFGALVDENGAVYVHPLAKEGTSYTSTTIYLDVYIFDLASDWQRRQTVS